MSLPVVKSQTVFAPVCLSYDNDPRWQLAVRISESAHFCKSTLLVQFLLFICERTLNGSTEELTEQAIGEHVFRRRPGYSTGEDNIVRSYAHRLRSRLNQYFAQDGRNEAIRISIPRGGYIAIFEENLAAPVDSEPSPLQIVAPEIPPPKSSDI